MASGYISVDYDGLEKRKYDANHVSDDICGVLATEFYPNMKKVNNYLVELRDLINNDSEFGLGEIAYSDKSVELDELEWNYNILFNFPIDFEKELQGVDDDFNTEFINDALALLSELNVDDIELNVTNTSVVIMTSDGKYDEATGQVNYLNREYGASENAFDDIDRLTIADFIGYDGNGGEIYYTRYMEGFTDVLFSSIMEEDESINDFLVRNAADMEQLVHGADFSQQKISSALVNFIAEAVDLVSLGVVPLVEGFVGYDFIRGDELDEFESIIYTVEGTVDIVTIGGGGAVGGNLSQVVFNEIAQEAVGQTVSYVAKKSGANDSTAYILEMAARIAAGSYLTKRIADSNTISKNDPLKEYVLDDNRGSVDLSVYIKKKANIVDDSIIDSQATIIAKGKTYDKLDKILEQYEIGKDEFLVLSRTPQHKLNKNNKELVYKIRLELTADVTDSAGVVKPGTQISKSIDAGTFKQYYQNGSKATLGGCTALKRDTDALLSDLELINSTGLKFEGSNFINDAGEPNIFYLVEGELMKGQPELVVRVSATTDAVELSDNVAKKFSSKYPNYLYNGYKINDVSHNNSYLNEIWTRNSTKQVPELSEITGIHTNNIVTEEACHYNRVSNPDTGTGITLNQANSKAFGVPEFFANQGRVGIKNGAIYRIDGNERKLVATIGRTGKIKTVK